MAGEGEGQCNFQECATMGIEVAFLDQDLSPMRFWGPRGAWEAVTWNEWKMLSQPTFSFAIATWKWVEIVTFTHSTLWEALQSPLQDSPDPGRRESLVGKITLCVWFWFLFVSRLKTWGKSQWKDLHLWGVNCLRVVCCSAVITWQKPLTLD